MMLRLASKICPIKSGCKRLWVQSSHIITHIKLQCSSLLHSLMLKTKCSSRKRDNYKHRPFTVFFFFFFNHSVCDRALYRTRPSANQSGWSESKHVITSFGGSQIDLYSMYSMRILPIRHPIQTPLKPSRQEVPLNCLLIDQNLDCLTQFHHNITTTSQLVVSIIYIKDMPMVPLASSWEGERIASTSSDLVVTLCLPILHSTKIRCQCPKFKHPHHLCSLNPESWPILPTPIFFARTPPNILM
jgi:hypothetical protein